MPAKKQSLSKLADSKAMKKRRQALTDPVRFQILGLLWRSETGLTAKDFAEHIGKDTNRLYYHLRILEDAGMIESRESRPSGRMLERVFVHKDPGRMVWDPDDPIEMANYLRAMMETSRIDGERAIFAMAEAAKGKREAPVVSWAAQHFETTHQEALEFAERLSALRAEYSERAKKLKAKKSDMRRIEYFFLVSEHASNEAQR